MLPKNFLILFWYSCRRVYQHNEDDFLIWFKSCSMDTLKHRKRESASFPLFTCIKPIPPFIFREHSLYVSWLWLTIHLIKTNIVFSVAIMSYGYFTCDCDCDNDFNCNCDCNCEYDLSLSSDIVGMWLWLWFWLW